MTKDRIRNRKILLCFFVYVGEKYVGITFLSVATDFGGKKTKMNSLFYYNYRS